VVFEDGTDIYFARQQVGRAPAAVPPQLPAGVEPEMGPIATGLGEIFMYTVEAEPTRASPTARRGRHRPAHAAGLGDRPQLRNVPGVTEVNTIGGFAAADPHHAGPGAAGRAGLHLQDVVDAVARNNRTSAPATSSATASSSWCACRARSADLEAIGDIVLDRRDGVPIRVRDVAEVGEGPSCAPARPPRTATRSCWAPCSC
jgi:cobalt-zinc-cadmium resistance protein CzcA